MARDKVLLTVSLFLLASQLLVFTGKSLAQRQDIAIGTCGALSGRAAAYGLSVKQGAQLAVERINAAGGVEGKNLTLTSLDDLQDETVTSEKITSLIYDSNVLAIIGTTDSGCTHVAARIALKARLPLIATVATDPTLTRLNNPYVYRNLADDRIQGRTIVDYIVKKRQLRRIVIAHVNTRYGRGGAAVVETAARLQGEPLLKRLSFETGQNDFSQIIRELSDLRPNALIIWGLYAEGAALTKAVRQRMPNLSIFGPDGLASPAYIEQAGNASDGVVVTYPFNPDRLSDPVVSDFVSAFKSSFGKEPDSFAAHAYDAVYQIAEAVRVGGPTRLGIRDGLARMSAFHGVTGVFTFDPSGNSTLPVFLAEVRNQRFKVLGQ